jgi:dTDP-4-dehydrorhamnose reductase
MSWLVFGKTGQVAHELQRAGGDVLALGRDAVDLTDAPACAAAIRRHRPWGVINAAAYTAVDRAESEPALAHQINAAAPAAMAQACRDLDIPFVHISTDYVFAGTGTAPWQIEDAADPQNAYGKSKWAGEVAIRAIGGRYGILRTSWVFSAHGANFVKTMLRLSESRSSLAVVADQIGGPTSARAIAAATRRMAEALAQQPSLAGTYHFSGAPDTSWAGFATAIFAQAGRAVVVQPITSAEYPTPAKRPLNSRLDCAATQARFGIARPDWQADLAQVLQELGVCR